MQGRGFAVLAVVLANGAMLSGCGVEPAIREMMEPPLTCQQVEGFTQEGTASWYGRFHQGRPTASGEPYDMNRLTAAHRRLPLGSRVKVTNLENGREAEVLINDRGPFVGGRILDMSAKGAKELGFTNAGTAPIRLEVEACGKEAETKNTEDRS
jgi:rare lipoprotein A